MSTTTIVIIIVTLLLLGVAASAYIQFREQVKAEKRQRIAKYRYRAREGQELYDRFFDFPIGPQARQVILQYIAQNLSMALNVEPNQPDVKQSLDSINGKLTAPDVPADSQGLNIPYDPQEIVVMMGKVKNLMRYVHKIGKTPGMDINVASKGLSHLKKLYLQLQTHTFIGVARKSADEKNFPQAKQYLENAKKSLLRQNISDANTQKLLGQVEEIEQEIKALQDTPIKEEEDVNETADLGDTDDLFQPKKKW